MSGVDLDLYLPRPKLGPIVLPLNFRVEGTPVLDVLAPVSRGAPTDVSQVHPRLLHWTKVPLHLPADEGLDLPVPAVGTIGFAARPNNRLLVRAPGASAREIAQRWGRWLEDGPMSDSDGSLVATYRVEKGLLATFSIPVLGVLVVAHPDTTVLGVVP